MALRNFSRRAMWKRPGRTILTVLSIVIGVAAVVSVSLMSATTGNAYQRMFAAVTGRAGLVVEGAGQSSFSEKLLGEIEAVPGVEAAVPAIQREGGVYANDLRIRLRVMGVDPERDHLVRDYEIKSGRGLGSGREMLLDEAFARRLNVQAGDEVRVLGGSSHTPVQVVGIRNPSCAG